MRRTVSSIRQRKKKKTPHFEIFSIFPLLDLIDIKIGGECQTESSFGHRHSIQGKGSIWRRRGGRPAIGIGVEEAKGFIRLALEKAGLPPVKVLLKLL
ncbi:MAG: hypothetical protein WBI18_01860, partial [Candidatus Saccharicenans sp.]